MFSTKGELRNARAAYIEIVGKPAINLESYTVPAAEIPTTASDATEKALENNPAILSAKYDIKAALKALESSKSSFYPRVDLELEASRQQNLDGQKGASNAYLAMARIRYNLYDGGADKARKREQSARAKEAEDTLSRDKREVEERTHEAWNNLQTAKSRLKPLKNYVISSTQTKKAYKSQFDIGQRSLLDLLDSEVENFNAKTSYINGKYAADFAVYELLTTSGDILNAFKG